MPLRLLMLLACLTVAAEGQPVRRALLIGIDDYTASTIPGPESKTHRGWPDLKGAVNDVRLLAEMLVHVHGFEPKNIVTLTNQRATRAAIVQSIEQHLVRPARKGDVVFYYFAGHGAQVPNRLSDEPDRMDESIVPADSRRGAQDIRDKQLRGWFNQILDRGAHLTLLLDHCHSGGGFRGLPNGARPRGIAPAPPIADGNNYGPRPEERGALVLVSTQDLDKAWEDKGEDGQWHGVFTWAWIRAMRDAVSGESAEETFLRAQARLRGEVADQAPAMLARADARTRPFLGHRIDRRGDRAIVAVERVEPDGNVVLQGGWANGLADKAELTPTTDRTHRLRVTKILGLGRSIARMKSGRSIPPAIRAGALLEIVTWAPPQERPLRVWTPRITGDVRTLARRFMTASKAKWINDPLTAAPTHVLRPRASGWELLDREGRATPLPTHDAAVAAIARLPRQASLFVQLPVPEAITAIDGIENVNDPKTADYLLAGRFDGNRVEYAWIRPLIGRDRKSGLPLRSAWTREPLQLRRDVVKLRKIHSWHTLTSPPNTTAPYRLAVRHEATRRLVGSVTGDEVYSIVLRASGTGAAKRYYYVFVIDSAGKSHLVFPAAGSVENRFPIGNTQPAEIPLGQPSAFRVTRPYGLDTYFLLSTEEPLPNPEILRWDGVRAGRRLMATRWSIERVTIESVAPPRRRASAGRAAPRRR